MNKSSLSGHSVRIGILILLMVFTMVFATMTAVSSNVMPVDFVTTFYPAGRYLIHDADVYASDYTDPRDGTQHPPYNPIWILYAAVPLSFFPVEFAGALRFLIDLASLPLLAYLCARWAELKGRWRWLLLAIAPWFSILLYSGQWAGLAVIGALLCFWGSKRASVSLLCIGILLSLSRPNMTELVILASVVMAWQSRILLKTSLSLIICVIFFSLQQPLWIFGMVNLYVDRFIHPRPADSILLLPGWPWAQFALMVIGAIFVIAYLLKTRDRPPSPWFWAILVCIGLISALHAYTYDWVILLLPLAWLLRSHRAIFFVGILYLYPFLWSAVGSIPSPVVIPSIILVSMLAWRILPKRPTPVSA